MTGRGTRAGAELLGTFVLVFFAVGSAVFGIDVRHIGSAGVALAFGFVLLALAYALGPVSGCHINPAVTLGVLLNKGISPIDACVYVLAQCIGAIAAGGLLRLMVDNGGVTDETGGLGTNGWGTTVNGLGAFLFEMLGTFLLVLVVLLVTRADAPAPGLAGLAIGLVLGVDILTGVTLTGTGVNPARSLGPALFYWPALPQLWLFIVAPLLGAVLAAGAARFLAPRPVVTAADPVGQS